MVNVQASQEKVDLYLSQFNEFEKSIEDKEPTWLHEIRKEAIAHFNEIGFPTLKHEEWRQTNIKPILQPNYQAVSALDESGASDAFKKAEIPGLDALQLVFINGCFSESLSKTEGLPEGVLVKNLQAALQDNSGRLEPYLARKESYEKTAFASLNTAFLNEGACVFIPKDTVVEKPIQILYLSTEQNQPYIVHPRTLLVAGNGSKATVIESYIGTDGSIYLNNAVTEVIVGENANIEHIKYQRESEAAFHVTNTQINLDRSCNYIHNSLMFGGLVVRNDITKVLNAEGIDSTLNGIYMLKNKQHTDNNTRIVHAKPNCNSWELYKGILDDESRGVFRGRIFVAREAQKTDAKQSNRSLLLSDKAEANAMPQLEIFADDVKCTHGATTGQIDDDALFYLRSRGIDQITARALLTYAFASEMVGEIGLEPVQEIANKILYERLSHEYKN